MENTKKSSKMGIRAKVLKNNPALWNSIPTKGKGKNKKLVGMLTDELVASTFFFNGGLPCNGTSGGKPNTNATRVNIPKVNKSTQHKFSKQHF